jgi:parallel beta-helix repeat protein
MSVLPLKKGLTYGIIVFFLSTTTIPILSGLPLENIHSNMSPSLTGTWLYVGGSGLGNFSRIQDAVDNALDGDTVYVYDDLSPYYEHVVVNISVNLIGEDVNTTIIDGNGEGTVVLIAGHATSITMYGFTVQHSGNGTTTDDAGIKVKTNKNIIRGNIFRNDTGMIIIGSNNTISGNIFRNNTANSIVASGGWNTIAFNTIVDNKWGVSVGPESYHNTIYKNYINHNGDGITLWGWSVSRKTALLLDEVYKNDIYGNTIIHNGDGIIIYHYWETNVFENNISDNGYGISLWAGWMGGTTCNNIYQNIIDNNTCGIDLQAGGLYSVVGYNNFTGNNITHNKIGMLFTCNESQAGGCTVGWNAIYRNNISYNDQGITLFQYSRGTVKKNLFYQNNFMGNRRHVYDEGWNIWYNASKKRGNYWDDYQARDILPPRGVGDQRYIIGPRKYLNRDKFPLMKPYPVTVCDFTSLILPVMILEQK